MMAQLLLAAVVAGAGVATAQQSNQYPQSQASDADQRWRLPLADKARIIQENITAAHEVEGTYVPSVPLPPDFTTTGNNGDMHTSSWTGSYILAAGFRLGWAREHGTPQDVEAALDHGGHVLGGITMLSRISGTPGLLARYVVHGHGMGPEERGVNNERNWWLQGKPPYQDFRYRSHPSHHNYHHMLRGLATYYYFLTKDNPNPSPRFRAQVDSVKALVTEMMNFAHKKNNMVLIREDGSVSAQQILSGVPSGRPSTKGMMATNSLRWGYWITGDRWYKQKYDELVARYNYRNAGTVPPDQWQVAGSGMETPDFDDTEHIMASLWLTYQVEDDQQLKDFYRMAATNIFASKRAYKRSPVNYFYAAITGDRTGADLPGALETMRLFPSDWTILPIMNSIRTDIQLSPNSDREGYGNLTGRTGTAGVLPFNQQPYDNAFSWKNDPFQLDRYLAREITSFAVSAEDPSVMLMSDASGELYLSRTAGDTWEVHTRPVGAAVRGVTFAANKNRVVVIATDKGIYWSQGGGYNGWTHVTVGSDTGAVQVMVDPDNANVVWAVMGDGVYRSEDLGIEEVGKAWTKVSRPFPGAETGLHVWGVKPGANARVYVSSGGRIYSHAVGDDRWVLAPRDAEDYHYLPTFRRIAVSPADPNLAFAVLNLNVWGSDTPIVLRTVDGGRNISIIGTTFSRLTPGQYIPVEGSGLAGVSVTNIAFDRQDPRLVYAAAKQGFYRSEDGGVTWQPSNSGLRIPLVYNVFAPRETPGKVYVTTPAGVCASTDQGRTWSRPIVVLNGPGTRRIDRGGMCYLVGYWPGRYFGLLPDDVANASPDTW